VGAAKYDAYPERRERRGEERRGGDGEARSPGEQVTWGRWDAAFKGLCWGLGGH